VCSSDLPANHKKAAIRAQIELNDLFTIPHSQELTADFVARLKDESEALGTA
jgi:hypothetical protein